VDLRDVVNALPFIASTGCQWRMLLKSIRVGYVTVSRLRAAGTAIRRSKPPPQSLRRLRLHDKHGALPLRGFALASCTPQALERSRACALVVAFALALLMAGCNQETKTEPPLPRPVRTVTVEKGAIGDAVQLTGDIRAENEVNLAFRIGGRIIERKGEVGDKVEPDQVLAKLDPQDELNTLRSAQAALNAARGQDVEAQNTFDRQNHLMERGFTTRANFDSAKQAL
jgi:hypothetical protein